MKNEKNAKTKKMEKYKRPPAGITLRDGSNNCFFFSRKVTRNRAAIEVKNEKIK